MPDRDSPQQQLEDELTAYLDGELDAESVRRVEERLARDAGYRGELNQLERAWNLLDRLPRASVDEKFTKTTIEMVATSASQEAEAIARELPRRKRRQRAFGAIAMLAALAVGFLIGTRVWMDPNEQLLADLPVLENLDLYYQADEIEFLRLLAEKGSFDESNADEDAAEPPTPAADEVKSETGDTLAARRARIASLGPEEQQELLRKYERFSAMPPEDQQRLRELQAEISADPHAERLQQALVRHHEWLKTITPSQRAALAEENPQARVKKIEIIRGRQLAAEKSQLLSRHDRHDIMDWIHDLVKKHRGDIVDSMSRDERAKFDQADRSAQRRWLIFRTFRAGTKTRPESRVTQQDIDRLAEQLSSTAQAELAKATTLPDERKVVGMWVYATLNRAEAWHRDRRVHHLVGEELLNFLQNEVSPARREQLLKMPREEMLRELRKMYFEHSRGGPGMRRPRGGDRFRGGSKDRTHRDSDGRRDKNKPPRQQAVPTQPSDKADATPDKSF